MTAEGENDSTMTSEEAFRGDNAKSYDSKWERLDPFRQVQHLLLDIAFDGLPDDARILCVGAGTGAELLHLAKRNPGWSFTAVDPAADMLAQCREKMEEIGAGERCTFHVGYIETLENPEPFHGASSLLVSHFILDKEERLTFFTEIAKRLAPDAPLLSTDISADSVDSPLFDFWMKTLGHAGQDSDQLDHYRKSLAAGVSVLPPRELAGLIESAGFAPPVQVMQTVMVGGWYSRKRPSES